MIFHHIEDSSPLALHRNPTMVRSSRLTIRPLPSRCGSCKVCNPGKTKHYHQDPLSLLSSRLQIRYLIRLYTNPNTKIPTTMSPIDSRTDRWATCLNAHGLVNSWEFSGCSFSCRSWCRNPDSLWVVIIWWDRCLVTSLILPPHLPGWISRPRYQNIPLGPSTMSPFTLIGSVQRIGLEWFKVFPIVYPLRVPELSSGNTIVLYTPDAICTVLLSSLYIGPLPSDVGTKYWRSVREMDSPSINFSWIRLQSLYNSSCWYSWRTCVINSGTCSFWFIICLRKTRIFPIALHANE